MSSWLDLVNFGLNAAHSYQIQQTRAQLQRMETDAVESALHAQLLEIMRNFVFEIAQDIKALEDHLQTAPQQVYVVAHALRWRFQNMGITPEIFPEFVDKEYVQKTRTKIGEAIQSSKALMRPSQLTQAETAVKFVTQSDLLQQAIEAMSAKEKLQASESEWKAVSTENQQAKNQKGLGCLALFGSLFIVPGILFSIVPLFFTVSELLGGISTMIAALVSLGCIVGSINLMVKSKSKPKRYEELKEMREGWRNKLLPRETWEEVVRLWGEKSSYEYKEIQQSHNDFLRGMFGQVEGFDKFLPVED
jgi:hypothetical protein